MSADTAHRLALLGCPSRGARGQVHRQDQHVDLRRRYRAARNSRTNDSSRAPDYAHVRRRTPYRSRSMGSDARLDISSIISANDARKINTTRQFAIPPTELTEHEGKQFQIFLQDQLAKFKTIRTNRPNFAHNSCPYRNHQTKISRTQSGYAINYRYRGSQNGGCGGDQTVAERMELVRRHRAEKRRPTTFLCRLPEGERGNREGCVPAITN